MKKSSRRILAGLILVAALAFIGWRVSQAYEKKQVAEATTQPRGGRGGSGGARVISVSTTQARNGSVRDEIEITGSLKPKEQVDVSSQVTGRVRAVHVQIGDSVTRGQLIAQLEDAELEQQVRRGEGAQAVVRATLQQRRAELANAKADLDRARQLTDSGLISKQEYETKVMGFRVVQSQIALAEAQGEQAAAELNELKIRLQQMRIIAPVPGSIAQRFVDIGAVVSPSTPIVRVVNLSTLVTVANVPEQAVSRLRVGNRALVRVDAFGDQVFNGRVARISPVLDAATRTALVEVEIPNPTGALRAEMFARVKLDLGTTREAVLVPREALVYRGQQAGVFVLESKRPAFRTVETGATQGQDVEVLSNLAAGTRIIGRGAAMLTEGDQIRIVGDKEADRAQPGDGRPRSGAGVQSQPRRPVEAAARTARRMR